MITHLLDCFRDDPKQALDGWFFIGLLLAAILTVIIIFHVDCEQATLALSVAAEQVAGMVK